MTTEYIKPIHPLFQDLEGKKFHRLTVNSYQGKLNKSQLWLCTCECGNKTLANTNNLNKGHTKSCGCLARELTKVRNRKHGAWSTDRKNFFEYEAWQKMKGRCYNPNNNRYKYYGARGIKVCERWRNSFENFLADMGEKPNKEYSLDRIDVNGEYSPENCRWADRVTQANNKRTNIRLEYKGVTKSVNQWAEEYNIGRSTLLYRIKLGWSIEKALTKPIQKQTFKKLVGAK